MSTSAGSNIGLSLESGRAAALPGDSLPGAAVIPIPPAVTLTTGTPGISSTTLPEPAPLSPRQMQLVLEVSRKLTVTTDLDMLLTSIVEACTRLLGCERASIFLHDDKTQELWTKVALLSKEIRVPCSAGIVGHVFTTNSLLLVPDPYQDARFNQAVDKKSGFTTRNLLTAPMLDIEQKPDGVLQAVNKCDGGFSSQDVALIQLLADQAGVAIQRHRLQVRAEQGAALRREMDLARTVQEKLIPETPPEMPGYQSVGFAQPASITGGDGYDLWRLRDGRLAVFLGDATGHGIAPAMMVSQVRTLIRALSETLSDPHAILGLVNARMAEDLETGKFVTTFLGFLSPDGRLDWSSAGHGPILLRRAAGQPIEQLPPCGLPIGIMPEWLDDCAEPLQVGPGGCLVVMSDGIFESQSAGGDLFGVERVIELLDSGASLPLGDIVSSIRAAVRHWQGNDEPLDDQTMVMIHRI